MSTLGNSLRLAVALGAVMAALPAQAETVEEFYKGKQIKLIVGQPPGNRGDVVARLVTKHMTRFIPGNPIFVAQNMPAAGTLAAANYVYNVAPKDGTVFGVFSRAIPVQALMGQQGIQFDPRKFSWVGSPEGVEQMCLSYETSPVKTAEDLFTKELVVGGSGPTTVTNYVPIVLQSTLGMKFKLISGYAGAAEIFLAMERGEVQGICTVYDQITGFRPDWIKQKKINLLFHTSTTPSPTFPSLKSVYDFVKTDEQRQVIFFVNSGVEFGRPFAGPPEIPADRLKAVRDAFEKTLKDPEFLAEAKTIDFEPVYTSGAYMEKLVTQLYATPKPLIDKSAEMMGMEK
jgi:tripartite-type tricarboxylate transporter receptor subunit TctC